MKLVDDWKTVLKTAWTIRWALLAGALAAAEVAVPLLNGLIPAGYFAAASALVAFAIPVVRIVAQKQLADPGASDGK